MPHTDTIAVTALLAIPATEPERLFPRDPDAARTLFKALVKRFHPDTGSEPDAGAFALVVALRDEADRRREAGTWTTPGQIEVTAIDGTTYRLRYRHRSAIPEGEVLIGPGLVAWLIDPANRAMFDQAIGITGSLSYLDDAMRAEIERYMPRTRARFETADRLVWVVEKTPDVVRLDHLVAQLGGTLPPTHAAWVVSRLCHLVTYFSLTGMTHNALGPSTLFVSAQHHTILPLGGWWYAARRGTALRWMTEAAFDRAPPDMLKTKRADGRLDQRLVRDVGCQVLGHPGGSGLRARTDIPAPMADWLLGAPADTALEDFKAWSAALAAGFGPRRFIPLPVDPDAIYPEP